MFTVVIVCGIVYVIVSYVVVGAFLFRYPGPAGLGLLCLPVAPLVLPYSAWQEVKGLWKRIVGK